MSANCRVSALRLMEPVPEESVIHRVSPLAYCSHFKRNLSYAISCGDLMVCVMITRDVAGRSWTRPAGKSGPSLGSAVGGVWCGGGVGCGGVEGVVVDSPNPEKAGVSGVSCASVTKRIARGCGGGDSAVVGHARAAGIAEGCRGKWPRDGRWRKRAHKADMDPTGVS